MFVNSLVANSIVPLENFLNLVLLFPVLLYNIFPVASLMFLFNVEFLVLIAIPQNFLGNGNILLGVSDI